MELIIHTKYAIGQEVYLKKTALDFSRGSDNGKTWKFSDYILLLFAGVYAPLSVGVYIGKFLKENKVYKEE